MKTYKSVMSGMSYAFPLLVTGSLIIALHHTFMDSQLLSQTVIDLMKEIGDFSLTLFLPVLAAGIAFEKAGKIAIAPAMICSGVADHYECGFIGAILVGLSVGTLMNQAKKVTFKEPIRYVVPTVIYPIIFGLLFTLIFTLYVAPFLGMIVINMTRLLLNLPFIIKIAFGVLVGYLMVIDRGGPINKSCSLVMNGLYYQGVLSAPVIKMMGGMVGPIGVGLAYMVKRKKGSLKLISSGLLFVTESLNTTDSIESEKIKISTIIGTTVATGIIAVLGVTSYAIQGGILVSFMFSNFSLFTGVLLLGGIITAIVYLVIDHRSLSDNSISNKKIDKPYEIEKTVL